MCDPDLDIGVNMSKKTKDSRNDVRLLPAANSELPDMRAVTSGTEWVSTYYSCAMLVVV